MKDVDALIRDLDRPLAGVIHSAGVLDDGTLPKLTPEMFRRVYAPKVDGAINLHRATLDLDLDLFVLFASASGVLELPGQGNYSAANAFLDALAHHRRAMHLPALSIDWGAWAEVGLAAADEKRGARLMNQGLTSMQPGDAATAVGRALAMDLPNRKSVM